MGEIKKLTILHSNDMHGDFLPKTVDGKETELIKTDVMYMGAVLEPGTHYIELRYQTPHLKEGAIVSLSAILMGGLYSFVSHKLHRRRKKTKGSRKGGPRS